MENLQGFIKIGDDRIDAKEIIRYGLGTDEDNEDYLYVETKTSDDYLSYYEDELDVDVSDKLEELDKLFLIEIPGQVDFPRQFVKISEDRFNLEEIVRYGIGTDEDDDNYLYVETKTNDDLFEYYEDDTDFDVDEKLGELDGIFLIR